ncbi:3,4-dihydroxy-2-butanone-4-phosphate synthase [Hansschlegelia sp.]|uniref:3,4-dihydroxy-2-butanone-4-phosphate synthase n=1 Tax=Hansschlegelia sp. TaxID=2041892 RepID=UPI002CB9EABB|nr:3,4-dihydroxy-2-butanone-4-phosphate synthase [Hansschlegelia sp.]HVI28699.1 3,4-dihydroxy-2-butanone-4-phosphate synthase [Hansschlegelia sp.]
MNYMPALARQIDINTAQEIIEEARAGRPFILVDDEDRENEGDIVIPAQFATPEAVNFMARHARGLVCLALTQQRVSQLHLAPMAQSNRSGRHQTAFTLSIEARTGVTTGISAADRARTIAVAINPESRPDDIVTPGHIFPLIARDGGTLIRAGHTEAAVDVARIAGLNPAGVICEIMNDDGSMARLPQLLKFARRHELKLGTIADLIAYRLRTERLVELIVTSGLHHPAFGEWRMMIYRDTVEDGEHIVLAKGDLRRPEPTPVCIHMADPVGDMLLAGSGGALEGAMYQITRRSRGVVVILNDPRRDALSERIRNGSPHSRPGKSLRDYGVGAQILIDLGVSDMVVISDTNQNFIGLEGYGLNVVEHVAAALQ